MMSANRPSKVLRRSLTENCVKKCFDRFGIEHDGEMPHGVETALKSLARKAKYNASSVLAGVLDVSVPDDALNDDEYSVRRWCNSLSTTTRCVLGTTQAPTLSYYLKVNVNQIAGIADAEQRRVWAHVRARAGQVTTYSSFFKFQSHLNDVGNSHPQFKAEVEMAISIALVATVRKQKSSPAEILQQIQQNVIEPIPQNGANHIVNPPSQVLTNLRAKLLDNDSSALLSLVNATYDVPGADQSTAMAKMWLGIREVLSTQASKDAQAKLWQCVVNIVVAAGVIENNNIAVAAVPLLAMIGQTPLAEFVKEFVNRVLRVLNLPVNLLSVVHPNFTIAVQRVVDYCGEEHPHFSELRKIMKTVPRVDILGFSISSLSISATSAGFKSWAEVMLNRAKDSELERLLTSVVNVWLNRVRNQQFNVDEELIKAMNHSQHSVAALVRFSNAMVRYFDSTIAVAPRYLSEAAVQFGKIEDSIKTRSLTHDTESAPLRICSLMLEAKYGEDADAIKVILSQPNEGDLDPEAIFSAVSDDLHFIDKTYLRAIATSIDRWKRQNGQGEENEQRVPAQVGAGL